MKKILPQEEKVDETVTLRNGKVRISENTSKVYSRILSLVSNDV